MISISVLHKDMKNNKKNKQINEKEEDDKVINQKVETLLNQQREINNTLPYSNPITFLFPELLNKGVYDNNKTIHYSSILIHISVKALFILVLLNDDYSLPSIIGLSLIEFWITKNWSSKKLIGLTYWLEYEEEQLYYFERINKLYPLNKYCQYYFWYVQFLYTIIILIIQILQFQIIRILLLLFPLIGSLANIWFYFNVLDGCQNDIYRYIESLTEYRLRRSLRCRFYLKWIPTIRLKY